MAFSLTPAQKKVLMAMSSGWTLKAHRYLDGRKLYRLHPLTGEPADVNARTVEALYEQGLIDSNKKFPAATFWLTPAGKVAAGH